jgi:type I restriction enzyme, R subunit
MIFSESNTIEAYPRDLLCGPNAAQPPLAAQQAIDTCGLGPAGAGWPCLPSAAVPGEPQEVFSEPLVRAAPIRRNPCIAAPPQRAEEVNYNRMTNP